MPSFRHHRVHFRTVLLHRCALFYENAEQFGHRGPCNAIRLLTRSWEMRSVSMPCSDFLLARWKNFPFSRGSLVALADA